jgi:hypothetical protein
MESKSFVWDVARQAAIEDYTDDEKKNISKMTKSQINEQKEDMFRQFVIRLSKSYL